MTFADFCDRLRVLHVAKLEAGPAPYKPIMVAAVVILIHKGKLSSHNVFLDGGLKSVFYQLLDRLFPDWPYKADAAYPFRHLESDGVWRLIPIDTALADFELARQEKSRTREVLKFVRCAELPADVFDHLAASAENRIRVLQILCEIYFPAHATRELMAYIQAPEGAVSATRKVPEAREAGTVYKVGITERVLEEHLEAHWDETPFARMGFALATRDVSGFVGRQVLTPVNSIDLLAYNAQERRFWVFELKRGRPPDVVVGQVSRYLGWILRDRKAANETAQGAVIAQDADAKLRMAIEANPNLSLWLFDDDLRVRQA